MAIAAAHVYINALISLSNSILHMLVFQSHVEFPNTYLCYWCLPPILCRSGLSFAITQVTPRICSYFSWIQCPHLFSHMKKALQKIADFLKSCKWTITLKIWLFCKRNHFFYPVRPYLW